MSDVNANSTQGGILQSISIGLQGSSLLLVIIIGVSGRVNLGVTQSLSSQIESK
jgi:hypothetical protein